MAHLFFSYAHADYDRLIPFQRQLEVLTGHKVWIDKIGLQHDAAWADMIHRAINGSYGMIFALTKTFADEPNRPFIHQKEIPWALERFNDQRQGKLLFVMRFDDVPLPASLSDPQLQYTVQTVDAFGRSFEQVIADLTPHLPKPQEGNPRFVVAWPRLRNFKGRDALLMDLHTALFAGDGAVGIKTAGLYGTGGIGKTQLAVEYAYRYQFYYPKGVFWVNAAEDWKAGLAKCADALGLPAVELTDKDDRAGGKVVALKEKLSDEPGEALIILDNVDNPAAVPLREVAPGLTVKALCDMLSARLIVTTRVQTLPDGFGAVEVSKLPLADAVAVLKDAWVADGKTAPRIDLPDDAALIDIATLFDGLPLPLGWMAAALRGIPSLSARELYTDIKAHGVDSTIQELRESGVPLGTPDYYAGLVGAALDWQLGKLDNPNATALIRLSAAYGEAAVVPHARLKLLADLKKTRLFDPFELAVKKLADYSLIEPVDGGTALRLHPLTRDHLRRAHDAPAALTEAVPKMVSAYREPATIAAQVSQCGAAAALADLEVTSAALSDYNPALTALLRLYLLESHRWLNPPDGADAVFYVAHLRDRAHHESDDSLREACDTWLGDKPHIRPLDRYRNPASPHLLRTLKGHTAAVNGALQLANGRVLSWSGDHTLRLWGADGIPIGVLKGHTDWVNGALELSDGRVLSWSDDITLRVWGTDGTPNAIWEGHTDEVIGALALSDRRVLSWSEDNTLRVWGADGTPIAVLDGHTNAVNGALALSDERVLSWSEDNTLRIWGADGTPIAVLDGHTDAVNGALALSDGRMLSWSEDNTLRLWGADGASTDVLDGHTASVNGALALSDGRVLSWSEDNTLRVWGADGTSIAVWEGHTDWMEGALVLSDGRVLSWSWDKTLRVWEADGMPANIWEGHTAAVRSTLALSGERILSWAGGVMSSDYTLRVWEADGTPVAVLEGHTREVNGTLALSGGRVLSWSNDGTLRLWTTDSVIAPANQPTDAPRADGMITLSDEHVLAWREEILYLYRSDGTFITSLTGHTHQIDGALELSEGRVLSWSRDGTLRLWRADGTPIAVLDGHPDWVKGALELSDRRVLSWSRKTLRVWGTDGTSIAVLKGHTDELSGVLELSDGRVLSWSHDKTLRVWRADGMPDAVLVGHTSMVWGALELSDGRVLSWSDDHTLRVWKADGMPDTVLVGHTDSVWGALALSEGRVLSWSRDKTMRVWGVDGMPAAHLDNHASSVRGALVLSDGRVLSAGVDGYRLWGADGTPLGALTPAQALALPRPSAEHRRWWNSFGDLLGRVDFATGRVDAVYLPDAGIRRIAPLSPTRCTVIDSGKRLFIVEFVDGGG